jgi:alpha-glucosidase
MLTSEAIHPDHQGQGAESRPWHRIGRLTRIESSEGLVTIYGERASVGLAFPAEGIVRIRIAIGGEPDWRTTPAVAEPSQSGRLAPEVRETAESYAVRGGGLTVTLAKANAAISVANAEGAELFRSKDLFWDRDRSATLTADMDEDSHFYGLGEKTGFLDKKGERYEMWNSDVYEPHVPDISALYQSIPFLIHYRYGSPACGVFLDDPGRTAFDMRTSADRYAIQSENGNLDLYVLEGPALKDVVKRYAGLTGKPPLPPRWAIGYQQSRYSYMSREEVLGIARTMREKRIPCDVIYLDIHYMDEYRVFTWDPDRFPDPKGMMRELAEMGFHVVPIVDPGVKKDPQYPVYAEGIREGYFCEKLEGDVFIGNVWPGPSAFTDYTDERAAQWWGDLHRFYIDHGIKGIWNDMNEPSVFNTESKTMDTDVVHRNGGNLKTHGEWHNLYGMLMSKATYEGMARGMDGERPFVLTRAGYAGIQRYAAVWTGDNRSYWEHMAMSIPMVLNLGLSGVAFAGPDIGGFSHHASGELVARWTQLGALFPFCRNHSAIDTPHQEPWVYGERVEAVCREYLGLRYRLMPYLYSLFYEAASTGLPIVRPLLLEYPEDRNASNLCDQLLLGRDLLAAPILRPGASARSVYLPEGLWLDYWTGERLEGGRFVLAEAPLEVMPLYVRAGAIVPEQPLRQYAEEAVEGPLVIRVYAGGEGSFSLFEDDGRTFGYESGRYRLREFVWTESGEERSLTARLLHDGFSEAAAQGLTVRVGNLDEAPGEVALSDGTPLRDWRYDSARNELEVPLPVSAGDFRLTLRR